MGLPPLLLEPHWTDVQVGDRVNFMADVVVWGCDSNKRLCKSTLIPRFILLLGELPNVPAVSVLEGTVSQTLGGLRIELQTAQVLQHSTPTLSTFGQIAETCTGIGCLGLGLESVGFTIQARNDLSGPCCKVLQDAGRVSVVEGNIGNPKVVKALHASLTGPTTLQQGSVVWQRLWGLPKMKNPER